MTLVIPSPSHSAGPSAAATLRTRELGRRTFLQGVFGTAALLGLGACAKDDASGAAANVDASSPLPTSVPPGTELVIASATSRYQLALELSGLTDELEFTVPEWPDIADGPNVINAFRANSLDLGTNAGLPPINAHYQGYETKIVAVSYHRKPLYVFATRPGSDIGTVEDFAGKKLAFSEGQAQGAVILRALDGAGIDQSDVELVPLIGPQFLTALQSGQVDVAPLGLAAAFKYLEEYGSDGARKIETDVVDLLSVLWSPSEVLADEAKTAAIASFIPVWARSSVWVYEHPDEWIEHYYVASQNLPADEAAQVVEFSSKPEFPANWDDAIAWEQETVDLLAQGGFVDSFDAEVLFDRRFETLAADAVAPPYKDTDVEYHED